MKYPHVTAGLRYIDKVLDGTIPACQWVKLACQRHLNDVAAARFIFDNETAELACRFLELFPHTKGKWAKRGIPFRLSPFQCFATMSIFGWLTLDHSRRRFNRAYLSMPRKNGKSDWAARVGLLMLANDGEAGAEVYSGATSQKQAMEVFRPAWRMAKANQNYQNYYGVTVPKSDLSPLFLPQDGSRFVAVIGKPGDGASPSLAIVDEYHEHDTDELLDTMETGMGAREQPLSLIITTAGSNLGGPCHALQLDLQQILQGHVVDERFWGIIYTIDLEEKLPDGTVVLADDPYTEDSLRKANPNYDISVDAEFLKSKMMEAARKSSKQGIFQTKHLNIWVGSRNAFFNIKVWDTCPKINIDMCRGHELFLGVDLASKRDLASIAGVFKMDDDRLAVFGRHYLPESATEGEENQIRAGWVKDGNLIATPGNMIDHDRIEQDIKDIYDRFGVTQLGFDPAQAPMMMTHLQNYGIECIEIRPTTMNFSEPMKTLDAMTYAKLISHDHNLAMRWMMSNVVSKTDNKDNVYPNKEKPESKIDGPVALIIAINRALASIEDSRSAYDDPDWEPVMA